jgi:hypothetical protein
VIPGLNQSFDTPHLAAAEVPEETTVLFLIPTTPPTGEAEVIYQAPPDPTRMNYAALAAVGAQRLYEYRVIHRFAAYQEVDEAPFTAIATELRHEAQHARQFDLFGPKFHELDRILRDLVREHPSARYEGIPTERDANRAASAYASEHYPDDLEAMAEDDRFRQYTVEIRPVEDLIEETVGMIRQRLDIANMREDFEGVLTSAWHGASLGFRLGQTGEDGALPSDISGPGATSFSVWRRPVPSGTRSSRRVSNSGSAWKATRSWA